MKRFLLVGAMLFAAGCGGEIPAPWACPVTDAEMLDMSVYVEVKSADSGHPLAVWVTGAGEPLILRSPSMRDLALSQRHILVGRAQTRTGSFLVAEAAHFVETGDVQPIHAHDAALVTADRNCDLLIELRQKGDDPLTLDVRWIKRVE